ncbi:MAG: hypothetical protein HC927_11760 [Deltaproteobacteria bacterium]|nr:hypothetical protein [Deltaproteobacteria bacterium]
MNGWNGEYLEAQYEVFRRDPSQLSPDLRAFFQGYELASTSGGNGALMHAGVAPARSGSAMPPLHEPTDPELRHSDDGSLHAAVLHLINAYRRLGHLAAQIDPFGRERETPTALLPSYYGFTEQHLDQPFHAGTFGLQHGNRPMPLRTIIELLDDTYCRTIGVEIDYITSMEERLWLKERIETPLRNRPDYDRAYRVHILEQLHRAELWERFCHKRYPGVKRFSLEGGETLIPMLHRFVESCADDYGVKELVLAMSHRGRLNVLTNIVGKTAEQIFTEFEDAYEHEDETITGDVKYHRGYSSEWTTKRGNSVWLVLASNPSHLESVGPVALGRCRAKQRLGGDTERSRCVPLLMHGDAAFIGQGVVAEAFNMSCLEGYTVGGTVHIVVNNLLGFTTGPEQGRSSRYCTDFAKQIEAPVFHVNGEDPEAAVHMMQLALDYRMQFKKDVVVDLVCYRRHGHNESDEAAFTQPLLYSEIKRKPSVLKVYAQRLQTEGVITRSDVKALEDSVEENLDKALTRAKEAPVVQSHTPGGRRWVGLQNRWSFDEVRTGVLRDDLIEISQAFSRWPEHFKPHPKVAKLAEQRSTAVAEDREIDWALAEQLAVGSLLINFLELRLGARGRVAFLSVLEYYRPVGVLRGEGWPWRDLAVLWGAFLVLWTAAGVVFARRDIATT